MDEDVRRADETRNGIGGKRERPDEHADRATGEGKKAKTWAYDVDEISDDETVRRFRLLRSLIDRLVLRYSPEETPVNSSAVSTVLGSCKQAEL